MRAFLLVGLLSLPGTALAFSGTSTAGNALESAGDHQALLERLEHRIAELEAKLVAAQERVEVLKDTVLAGVVSKAAARIVHKNEMGGSFKLARATFKLDGGIIFDREDVEGSLADLPEIVLFDGPITPGEHQIEVSLVFRAGTLGVFTYVEGYKYKVDSKYAMKAVDGRTNVLHIVSHDKGATDVTKETSDRLGVRYDFEAKLSADVRREPSPSE